MVTFPTSFSCLNLTLINFTLNEVVTNCIRSCFFGHGTCQIQNVWKLDNFRANSRIGDGVYNEVWGFVQDGQEYAVIGSMYGTFFFHITDENRLDSIDYQDGVLFV